MSTRSGQSSRKRPRPSSESGQALLDNFGMSESDTDKILQQIAKIQQECRKSRERFPSVLTDLELTRLSGEVIRFVLFKWGSAPGVPIPRREVIDKVNEAMDGVRLNRNVTPYVIPVAQERLAEVYGIWMKELQRFSGIQKKNSTSAETSNTTVFVLRSLLPSNLMKNILSEDGGDKLRGLAVTVLALIKANGGAIERDDLENYLEQLGLVRGEVHPKFGAWEKDALEVLEKRRYVMLVKKAGEGTSFYEVAENGLDEIPEEELDAFMQKLCRK